MKRILWAAGVYAAAVLAQLLCVIFFLFLQTDPLVKSVILAVLLLASGVPLGLSDRFLRMAQRENALDEGHLGVLYLAQRQVSRILAAGVLNLVLIIISGFFSIPVLLFALAALVLVLACAVGVIQIFRLLRSQEDGEMPPEAEPEESYPVPGGTQESTFPKER